MPSPPGQYNWLSRQLHWITVPLIIALFAMGPVMTELPLNKLKQELYAWHKWIGLLVLMLMTMRLLWRLASPNPPTAPAHLSRIIKLSAAIGHAALYVLVVIVPLIGWARSSTAGFEIVLLEVIPIPNIWEKDEELSKTLARIHYWSAYALGLMLLVHMAAALFHHTLLKDPVMRRMKPARANIAIIFIVAFAGLAFAGQYLIINPPEESTSSHPAVKQPQKQKVSEQMPMDGAWQVLDEQSELAFAASQKGSKTEGTFKTWRLKSLTFDPANLKDASVEVWVETASISFGNTMLEHTLVSSNWFDSAAHPHAVFKAKRFEKEGGDLYRIRGTLTIKSIEKPHSLTLTIKKTRDKSSGAETIKVEGSSQIDRLAYKIGEGEWESPEMLDRMVELSIRLRALKAQ